MQLHRLHIILKFFYCRRRRVASIQSVYFTGQIDGLRYDNTERMHGIELQITILNGCLPKTYKHGPILYGKNIFQKIMYLEHFLWLIDEDSRTSDKTAY